MFSGITYVVWTAPLVYTAYTLNVLTPYGFAIYCGTVAVKTFL